ncbi:hypothetical protein M2306_003214 [Myroides gitamensis]|uniref:Uncharacterized protein n=2 Tax=Myroides odoratus TaxID=256 RepID=A0A378U350_MYROD|nr:hypothetical protein [Myroides gitamensis]STZ69084.1 Uncharacterised protein [Myroides odoratus]
MKRLMTMSFLFIGTFSMLANGNPIETPKEEQVQGLVNCYKFEVSIVQLVNLRPVSPPVYYSEYGMYTEEGAIRAAELLHERFPTTLKNNTGQVAELGYRIVDSSYCTSGIFSKN